ncbi:hypothetical protein [Methylosinus sp. PW1]|uniref:hypothetical protein n=1 Tax=Methylosinus sp. PW1 TaxID=107636 RepID=UPI00056693A6|nr:hypothetical protein [Methylosinus sp. PW1]
MITQDGLLNTTSLSVPGVYVVIVPPQTVLNGVPSNYVGLVGVASWGPVNQAVPLGSPAHIQASFGNVALRDNDIATHATVAMQQGAAAIFGVRVTDGTDTAATTGGIVNANLDSKYVAAIADAINNGQSQIRGKSNLVVATVATVGGNPQLTVHGRYTGVRGNSLSVSFTKGTKAGTIRVSVVLGSLREVFDNIVGLSGAVAPAANFSVAFTGGTDGAAGVTSSTLLGVDGLVRTGLYVLRKTGIAAFSLADNTDSTTWAAESEFAISEGSYAITTGAPSEDITDAITALHTAGIDTPWVKRLLGDWVYWNDTFNGVSKRLVSPQAFTLGLFGVLSPQHSGLNKQLKGVVATQRSDSGLGYSFADISLINTNGLDVIASPSPGGNYFSLQSGLNTSSDASVNGDNYPRLTGMIARTIDKGCGVYVGQLQDADVRQHAAGTLNSYFHALQSAKIIGDSNGGVAWQVVIDDSVNDPLLVVLGQMKAYVKVVYLSVIRFFVVDLEAGQTVQITDANGFGA